MSRTPWTPNQYPATRRSDHTDVYKSASRGEIRIPDPYHWLEEHTEETDRWTSEQEAFTRSYLDKNPDLPKLEKAFCECSDYAKFSAPRLREDNRWYWYYNSGLQPQTAMYKSKGSSLPDVTKVNGDDCEIFFDQNALSKDGTSALSTISFSKCGEYFAYTISESGGNFVSIFVRSTNSPLTKEKDGGRLSDELKFVKFTAISWTPDSTGFFYQRYPENTVTHQEDGAIATGANLDAAIHYHTLGTAQSEDVLVQRDEANREYMYTTDMTEDSQYLLLYTNKDTSRKNLLWIAEYSPEIIGKHIKWKKVINQFEAEYDVIANDGPLFYLKTNKDAPQYKVITVDISKDNEIKELISERCDACLSSIVSVNKSYFALTYKRNVKDEIYIFSREGKQLTRLAEDFVGAATISGREKQPWFFVTLSGFTTPGTLYRYDFTAPEEQRWNLYATVQPNGLNNEDFEARQVWYESRDGTKVPMFIVRHKSTKFDGTAPAIQYGYGGFSISVNPFFSPTMLMMLRNCGTILAVPNIRGGGEFGEEWHLGGSREKKGNCFDDFIAAGDGVTAGHGRRKEEAIMFRTRRGRGYVYST
ncbi:hypothetical protein D9613_009989 [Agrocybe pediades]|uniref:Prolyl endopeptidase n=1 Tax=Agrocybe pediades TaxID=84607 RepID=A0A8H4QXA1_9AGAR|nr:hypothetical protein D9613_009989 [Agrocybe pediades]